MRNALSIYSDILILRDDTYRALKRSPGAATFILLMFFAVTLLAGCGKWLGLPNYLSRPTMAENVESVATFVDSVDQDVVASLSNSLNAVSQENLSFTLDEVLPTGTPVTSERLSSAVTSAGLTTAQLIALIQTQTEVPAALITELAASEPSAAVIDQLLEAASFQPAELRALLAGARISTARDAAESDSAVTGFLSGALDSGGVQRLLTAAFLTPDRVREITVQLGLDPATVNRLDARIEAAPEQILEVLDITERELELVEPPLGVQFSRLITFLGDWLSTPFQLLGAYLPLALMALVAAKLLGGKGTLVQHLFGMALAIAPAFLLFLTYAGNLGPGIPVTTQTSIQIAGRILGLIAFAWAFLILIKSLSVVHEFSRWRAVAVLVLTYGIIYILAPFLAFVGAGYLLRG